MDPSIDQQVLFQTLFAASPDALIVSDARGRIVLANQGASALLGYSLEELTRMEIDELVPDAIRSRHASFRRSYGESPHPRPMGTQMELAARRRDGSEVMVEIALSPLKSHGLPLVVAAIRDISAYPRMKQALKRARYSEHLAQVGRLAVDTRDPQALLEQVPAIAAQALELDVARVFLLEANRLEFQIAASVGDIEGEAVGDIVPNRIDTLPGHVLAHLQAVTTADYASEQRFAVPPGYHGAGLVCGLATPLSDRGRPVGVLAVSRRDQRSFGQDEVRFLESLSNLLGTSLQRAHTEEALNHAQRLESVGQLTGGIAHDFNNLLTVILGNLQVLEELPAVASDALGPQLVAAAMRAAKRGAELTGKLLAFSRRQMLQPTSVDAGGMITSLTDMLSRTLDQRIHIDTVIAGGDLAVLADPGQLESALLNIAINARDAMPEGGTLRFTAQPCITLPADVRAELDDPDAADDRFIALSVSDTGGGMSEAVRERAFEPFFTTKEAGRGTGLGLSTVYGFVKQSKGAVSINSALGHGTTLTLYIPRPYSAPLFESEIASSDRIPAGLHVLLVEDDAEVRAVVRRFLDDLGCHTTMAPTAEQAFMLLEPDSHFDLLITDIALGAGMRGTELAALAQARLPRMNVLLMSGYSAELLDADQSCPPDWELLRKPYSREELASAIARTIDGRRV